MKTLVNTFLLTAFVLLAVIDARAAAEFPVTARLFAGVTNADPTQLNQEMRAQSLQEFKSISKYGVEMTYKLTSYLDVGLNYTKRYVVKDETDSSLITNYQAVLNQDAVMAVVRVPFYRNNLLRFDAFAGIGGSNTSLTVKTASQDGELSKREGGDWFASLYSAYGGSVSIGWKWVYLTIEGGFESNKVDGFKRIGNINNNVQAIDLSGGYANVGLIFDGIPAYKK